MKIYFEMELDNGNYSIDFIKFIVDRIKQYNDSDINSIAKLGTISTEDIKDNG